MIDREQYTPGPANGAQVRKDRDKTAKKSGRSFSSVNCATRPRKSGKRLPTRPICESGHPLTPMGAWIRPAPR